jgi:peptidylprolyl isomerase
MADLLAHAQVGMGGVGFRPLMAARLLRLFTLIAVVAAALGAAACGDDDDDSASGAPQDQPAETTETSPSAQREALKDTGARPVIPRPSGTPPRRLQKDDIVRGKGPRAKLGDTLTVHYAGVTFSTGEEFDASWNSGEPFRFELGGQVIEGWNRGMVGMRRGGRRMLTIPPELAYGPQGTADGSIGPNETLVFVVDLLAIAPG